MEYCLISDVYSYKDLGRILTEGDPDFADADDKTLREIGKRYAKEQHGKISQRYFIRKCPKSWKQIYDGNPKSIDKRFHLEMEEGDCNAYLMRLLEKGRISYT